MSFLESQLRALAGFLKAKKIRYAILGGVAVSVYGEPRLTADIDINIIFDKKRIPEFLKSARGFHFYPVFRKAAKIAQKTGVLPLAFKGKGAFGKIDVIIAENPLEYAAIKRSRIKKLNSMNLRIVSPEDLIIHKITSTRPRDIEDLNSILMRQKGKLDIGYIRAWLKKIDRINKSPQLCGLFNSLLRGTYF